MKTSDFKYQQLPEAEKNKRHSYRLEALPELLHRTSQKTENQNEVANESFIRQFSFMLKRVAFKHADLGCRAAIFVALALGQNEIANFLRCSLGQGNILFLK